MDGPPLSVGGAARVCLRGPCDGKPESRDPRVLEQSARGALEGGGEWRGRGEVIHLEQVGKMVQGALLGLGIDPVLDRAVDHHLLRLRGVAGGVQHEHRRDAQEVIELRRYVGEVAPVQVV